MLLLVVFIVVVISIVVIWLAYHYANHNNNHNYKPLRDFTLLKHFYGYSPWLSVVVSIYNKQDIITTTIDSIINSSIFDFIEVILVDDCSKDNSLQIANEYANKYKNIRVITHSTNQSIFMTRKHGVEQAQGYYLHFMDGDDTVDKYFYEELFKLVNCNVCIYVLGI